MGCGEEKSPAPASTGGAAAAPKLTPLEARGRAAFGECAICHTTAKGGANKIGPNLWGVYGSPAAHRADFSYSSAMRRSDLIWTEDTLDPFLENPLKTIPGIRMSYRGQADPETRAALIAYLKTLADEETGEEIGGEE